MRLGAQDIVVEIARARNEFDFVAGEEKQLLPQFPGRERERSAETASVFATPHLRFPKTARIIAETVGVEGIVPSLPEAAAVIIFAAAPRNELQVDRALGSGIGLQSAGLDRHLLNRAESW